MDKSSLATFARAAAERGHVVASINYRLQGDDPVPSARMDPVVDFLGGAGADPQEIAAVAAFDDTLTALDFLLARPEIDPDRVTLWGSSAGAITAVYVGYGLDEFGIAVPPVAAVVDNWGGFFATPGDANALEMGDAPIWINHGTRDTTVPFALAEDIVQRSQDIGHHYVIHSVDTGHGFSLTATAFVPGVSVLTAVLDWLDEVVVAEQGCADPFYDLPAWLEASGHWAYCGPYMAGYPDHTFRDGQPITRAEAARLLYRVAGSPSVALLPPHGLSDVPPWIEDAVRWLVANDYAVGYPNGTFRPNRAISRGELTRMQHRIAGSHGVLDPRGHVAEPV
ncbi:MAG: S-layer homology domain-containing protein, partial [Actinomycetota bacterium]